MGLKETLGSQFQNCCIHGIIKHFILGDVSFANHAYDESYDLLDKCCDNKSGTDKYETLLSYFITICDGQEIELKLYFQERERYLDAIQFDAFNPPILSDFTRELSVVNKEIYVAKHYAFDWEYGVIVLDDVRCIELTINKDSSKYGVFQLENPCVGKNREEWVQRKIGWLESGYKKVSFGEFQVSRFWK